MSASSQAPRKNLGGRPSKKTAIAIARILKIAESGLPLHFAAKAGDITEETLHQWRQDDPKFARKLEEARLAAVERRWKRIEQAAQGSQDHPPDWKADAWSLERAWAQFFCRPEVQLSVNQSVSTGPSKNIIILGPERARILASRHEQIRTKSIALLDARQTSAGNGQGSAQQRPVASEPVAAELPAASTNGALAQDPLAAKPSSWWRPFIFGGGLKSQKPMRSWRCG